MNDDIDNRPGLTIDGLINYVVYMINNEVAQGSAKLVREAISDSGRTKRSISDETGIPYPTLNRKLKAQSEFNFSELFILSDALSVPPWKLTPTQFVPPASAKITA